MFNIIIFLLGAGILFFMALRSVLARRRLCTQGQKVTATVEGTVRSRDGGAYVPVSYTHLDVYKRQSKENALIVCLNRFRKSDAAGATGS